VQKTVSWSKFSQTTAERSSERAAKQRRAYQFVMMNACVNGIENLLACEAIQMKGQVPMSIRFVTREVHAWIDYPVGLSLIVMPFLLGIGSTNSVARWLSVGTGVAALALAMVTKHETGLIRLIPYPLHLLVDRIVGVMLLIAPLVLGFNNTDSIYYWVNAGALIAATFLLNAPNQDSLHDARLVTA